jgi:hypothetical protein
MNRAEDGKSWWLRITGLIPGVEYAFQYLVDGSLKSRTPILKNTRSRQRPLYFSETYPPQSLSNG